MNIRRNPSVVMTRVRLGIQKINEVLHYEYKT